VVRRRAPTTVVVASKDSASSERFGSWKTWNGCVRMM
jgi:hypothetical protein